MIHQKLMLKTSLDMCHLDTLHPCIWPPQPSKPMQPFASSALALPWRMHMTCHHVPYGPHGYHTKLPIPHAPFVAICPPIFPPFGKSLYSLIWDFLLSQINIWTTTTWSNVWVVLPKPPSYEFLIGFLIWTPASSICILQHSPISVWFYPCSYICNWLKMPKKSQMNEYSCKATN
jgi:hypothetical protein